MVGLYWLCGPRTCTGRSRSCATGSLAARKRAVRELLGRVAGRKRKADAGWYLKVMWGGRHEYVHRVVMEIILGRRLGRREHVHHLDGNRQNNEPGNLQLLSQRAHDAEREAQYPLVRYCKWCSAPFTRRAQGARRGYFCGRECWRRAAKAGMVGPGKGLGPVEPWRRRARAEG